MRIWNNSGDEVESCGNASRCIADLLFRETGRPAVTIDTDGGLLRCTRAGDGLVTVDMGVPRFGWNDIPLSEEFRDTRRIELQVGPIDDPILHSPSVVNVGNPHCIFWVRDVSAHDLARFGPMLEHHPLFPEGANISLAQVLSEDHLAFESLGARRRPHPGLRHRRLRRRGGGLPPAPPCAQGEGDAPRRRFMDRMARA